LTTLDGAADFELEDEIYHALALAPDITPLLSADAGESAQPLLWARLVGAGRVVYDALGNDAQSVDHPTHRRILRRAAAWALGGSEDEVRQVR